MTIERFRPGNQDYWNRLKTIAKELRDPVHWERDEDFDRAWIEHSDHTVEEEVVDTLDYILRKHDLTVTERGRI